MILSKDLQVNIFSYLPFYEQDAIIPQVCKRWYQWHQEKNQAEADKGNTLPSSLLKFVSQFLGSSGKDSDHKLAKLAFNNRLITQFRAISLSCQLLRKIHFGPMYHLLFSENTQTQFKAIVRKSEGGSKEFNVIWRPLNDKVGIHKRGKVGDYRFQTYLSVLIVEYRIHSFIIDVLRKIIIKPIVYQSIEKKKNYLYWEKQESNSEFIQMCAMVRLLLEIKLKAYIERLTELNVKALLSLVKLPEFESAVCCCDDKGLIKKFSKKPSFSFHIKNIVG